MMMKMMRWGLLTAIPLLVALLAVSCGDPATTEPGDTTPPAAIANLAAGAVTSNSVQLTWTAPGDDGATGTASQYDIRYSTALITAANFGSATAVSGAPVPTAAGTSQSVTATGLTAGTLYYFATKTADDVPNWSGLSNVLPVTTAATVDVTPPAAVTNLAAGSATSNSVQLTWTAPGDDGATGTANHYEIRYSTALITAANFGSATAVSGAPVPGAVGTSQSVTATGLTAGTLYYFAMKTADEVPNWSGLSNVPQATTADGTGDTAPPTAITNLATGTVTSSSVQLTWTAPGDDGTTGTANSYDIRYSTALITAANFGSATAISGAPVPTAAGTSQSMTVIGLTAGTLYHFAMKTADEVPNWSGLSNVVQATTTAAADVTPPAAITNLAAGVVTSNSVHLSWTAPGDDGSTGTAHEYDIRYSTAAITAGNFISATQWVGGVPAPTTAGTSQSVTVTGLAASTPYYFAMKTADEVPNWSGLSNVPQATTTAPLDVTPPAAITDLDASPVDSTAVLLTWTAPGDDGVTGTATLYDVRYSTSPITEGNWASATQATGEPAPAVAGTAQSTHVNALHPGTDYYFAMKTSDEVPNTSALSNVATAHMPVGPSNPPGLSGLALPDSVCISSTELNAQLANMTVTALLMQVRVYQIWGSAFFAPIDNIEWQQTSGGCWDNTTTVMGCSISYHVCKTGADYEYTLTYNGSCLGQNTSNWVAFRAVFNNDTRTGTFYMYAPNSTTVQFAWRWTEAADRLSGTYTFYQGDPASAGALASIDWVKSSDGNRMDVTSTTPEESKWVGRFNKTPCSGWMEMYQWDAGGTGWWREALIVWNADGTGFYDTYDQTGTLQEHRSW